MNLNNYDVSVIHDEKLKYPEFPYAPVENYPELKIRELNKENNLYPKLRELFFSLGLDKENFGTKEWNPFRDLIKPGQTALIKPNWVRDYNPIDENIDSLITHTSIIRVVLDYLIIAMKGSGIIKIADAPVQDCDFQNLCKINNIQLLIDNIKKTNPEIEFKIIDLRKTILKRSNTKGSFTGKEYQVEADGDPQGYSLIDLRQKSTLTDIDRYFKKYRITCYDHRLLKKHHNPKKHEYFLSNSILQADAIINIPKLKTHVKAGLTGALKNFIGANGHKEYLPHHINGSPENGGDQYIHKNFIKTAYNLINDHYWSRLNKQNKKFSEYEFKILKFLYGTSCRFGKDNLFEGNWYGNKTVPRTTLDINNIIYFYNLNKKRLEKTPVRQVLNIVDGIIAGEENGPLQPRAKGIGVIIAGFNPLIVDSIIGKLIGYDIDAIKTLRIGHTHKNLNFLNAEIDMDTMHVFYNNQPFILSNLPNFDFIKPLHWNAISID